MAEVARSQDLGIGAELASFGFGLGCIWFDRARFNGARFNYSWFDYFWFDYFWLDCAWFSESDDDANGTGWRAERDRRGESRESSGQWGDDAVDCPGERDDECHACSGAGCSESGHTSTDRSWTDHARADRLGAGQSGSNESHGISTGAN